MRYIILSDIHSNYEALIAVLKAIRHNIDVNLYYPDIRIHFSASQFQDKTLFAGHTHKPRLYRFSSARGLKEESLNDAAFCFSRDERAFAIVPAVGPAERRK